MQQRRKRLASPPEHFVGLNWAPVMARAQKQFYTKLFGWDYVDNPVGPDMVYTMLKQDGKDVGALYQLSPEMTAQGIPPHWLSYVSVTNADETAAKAKNSAAR